MIYTNQVQLTLHRDAIARDFVIFQVEKDAGDYSKSLLPDTALQECRALSVQYEWGKLCYILYARDAADRHQLREQLEHCDDDIKVEIVPPASLSDSVLSQLLLNAIPSLASGGRMCHNLTGGLYYLHPSGISKKAGTFYTLHFQLTWDRCIKMQVATFRRVNTKKKSGDTPRYLMDSQSGMLRRVLRDDPDDKQPQFEKKSLDPNRRNNIDFLTFDTLEHFEKSRVGLLHRFLQDASHFLSDYLSMELLTMDETTHISSKAAISSKEPLHRVLRNRNLLLEDTVHDRRSAALASTLTKFLEKDYGIHAQQCAPVKGDALIRIVHTPEYYSENPGDDPYGKAPEGCIVQHVTLENFWTERETLPQDEKEDPYLHKVMQELGIKLDIQEKRLQFYDWPGLHYEQSVFFVMAHRCEKKNQHYLYDRLRITPAGTLTFDSWDNLFPPPNADWEKIEAAFLTKKGNVNIQVSGIIYEDTEQIQVIRNTDRFTLPNLEQIYHRLCEVRPKEVLALAPLRQILQQHMCQSEKDREKCQLLLTQLKPMGETAPRQDIKKIIGLKSNLGITINNLYHEQTGKWIGHRMKNAESQEVLFHGILDIRHFSENGKSYYYSGYRPQSLQRGISRACRIREVHSTDGACQMERYLPLLAVDFVRVGSWTVIPFPFKYLREWRQAKDAAPSF